MKTYKNKFFDKIGYKPACCDALIFNMKNDKRNPIWKKQRKKYGGWDERATWNLNTFMTEQIYTWLKMYYKYATNKSIWTFTSSQLMAKSLQNVNVFCAS